MNGEFHFTPTRIVNNNFYVTTEQKRNTPSRLDNIDEDIEFSQRMFGARLVHDGGVLLKLPQVTIATGQVIFHRFYHMKSLRKHDVKAVAMSSIFLSAKLEETPKKIRDILNVFHHLFQKKEGKKETVPLDIMSQTYYDMKLQLINTERYILKELGFILHVEHPHKFVCSYMDVLGGNKQMAVLAWYYVNDSLHTDLCVQYAPEVIASAAVYMAARQLQIALPEEPCRWWELFDTTKDQIDAVIAVLLRLYSHPTPQYVNLKKAELAATRSPNPVSDAASPDRNAENSQAGQGPSPAEAPQQAQSESSPAPEASSSAATNGPAESRNKDGKSLPTVEEEEKHSASSGSPMDVCGTENSKSKDSQRGNGVDQPPSRSSERAKDEDRSRHRDRDRSEKDRDRDRDRERDRDRDYRDRDRDSGRDRGRDRDSRSDRDRDRDRDRDHDRDRDRDRDREKDKRDRDHHRHRSSHKDKEPRTPESDSRRSSSKSSRHRDDDRRRSHPYERSDRRK